MSTGPSRRKVLFESTQDLISRFELLPAYDKYVRPYIHQMGSHPEALSNHTPADATLPSALRSSSPSTLDKGKGKERAEVGNTTENDLPLQETYVGPEGSSTGSVAAHELPTGQYITVTKEENH